MVLTVISVQEQGSKAVLSQLNSNIISLKSETSGLKIKVAQAESQNAAADIRQALLFHCNVISCQNVALGPSSQVGEGVFGQACHCHHNQIIGQGHGQNYKAVLRLRSLPTLFLCTVGGSG